ncbi:MAG TPA: phosphoribosylformylglycinamidine synthase subunit PurS [Flavilitoribacter sp.]|nr:phosphoribosylformylglycinamidine synthase subunit PurS [Lewinella sp.]MCB9281507.1 phosphoribosylformylglycinamidine synthase subunit PurS [Lewinellaceae bacterium]HMQ63195.1 phosphoribosylformylglycinamidine synthase subunit PurS [Flavilitoribacter sp.]HMQ91119.1 phosphoribosylformylglycinamidine synthase subunit PurS [Flavilitoribacter sp.]
MKFKAEIDIMPHKELLDPQGKTVANNMEHVHIYGIQDVRIGKHISMNLEAASESEAREVVETACKKILANLIMETYTFELAAAE